jgi:hypothetical protein
MTHGSDIPPELISRLRRTSNCIKTSGDEAETLTRILLDFADVGWFHVQQQAGQKSETLSKNGAKRVDFVVGWNGSSLLLDTKCYTPLEKHDDGSVTFGLTNTELAELAATGSIFGLPVAVVIWDRKHATEIYVIDLIDRFQTAATVLDEPGRLARFAAHEICHLID